MLKICLPCILQNRTTTHYVRLSTRTMNMCSRNMHKSVARSLVLAEKYCTFYNILTLSYLIFWFVNLNKFVKDAQFFFSNACMVEILKQDNDKTFFNFFRIYYKTICFATWIYQDLSLVTMKSWLIEVFIHVESQFVKYLLIYLWHYRCNVFPSFTYLVFHFTFLEESLIIYEYFRLFWLTK